MYALVQYDDREPKEFKELIERNKQYCKNNEILHCMVKNGYEQYPPWWRKVFLIRELLHQFEAVLWVDTDAAIVSNEHYKTIFMENKHMMLSPNPPMLNSKSLSMFSAPFCAGIWAIKNTPEGKTILDSWCNAYNKNLWTKDDRGNWQGKGLYGGTAYEQGSFETEIWRTNDYYKFIQNFPYEILNYLPLPDLKVKGDQCPSSAFAVHYWKGNRSHIHQHWISKK